MANTLAERIQARLDALKLSPRKASLNAKQSPDFVRNILRGLSQNPRASALQALADVLNVPVEYLTEVAGQDQAAGLRQVGLSKVFVMGAVQAGLWQEAVEWEASDWYALTVMDDPRYTTIPRFGLEVRGNSMNRLYPHGTVLVCVKFSDLAREPKPGEKVICLRRSVTAEFEATVKEYQRDEKGRHVLWPRSTEPEFQQPIVLDDEILPLATGDEVLPTIANAGHFGDHAGVQDIWIAALVTQSVRLE
ncbi:MAG TPA: XRE family transcriptional regulator [Azospirillaceae bacterium]|nr:XRE family transcriptional regulator [Azospirillaceae bacterium]